MSQPGIGIVILAAGGSTKLGRPKQLVRFKSKSLFRHAVESALACAPTSVIVVLGSRSDEIAREIDGLAVTVVLNEEWKVGISSSINAGLSRLIELQPEINAAVIMLSDQPFVDAKTIEALFDKYRESCKPIVACEYDGVLGVPALFDRAMFDDLMALEGDAGARVIIRQSSADKLATIPAPEASFDVDTPDDWDRLRRLDAEGLDKTLH